MDIFKQLRVLFFVLTSGQIIYLFISLILVMDETVVPDKDFSTVWGFLIPVVVVVLVLTSKLLYNYLINSNLVGTSEDQKLNTYKIGNIVKFALLEGANLLSVTIYLFTGDFLYVGMFIIIMGIFLINIPGKEKFLIEFGLSSLKN